ncbi:hypothetical protein A2331_00890 [Candidatus Falkowbacteria bacterium RIFOXYB2_FULL_34_18]|uniref:Uncharacterized protein n=1 Tax=Candidatus Falkowbacteria bacterium RIFOXYD2_FULL_34_120 TaxID=1798007 RepID=A0A1F5TSG5_9BACT|nr:MAG: hypothetical protein A2331_00890 [Candidatus Falkowbacteria bacterium RIFOXYB2_FULL_34_18]OGF30197.1 MAG: hypothetical protein A2500_02220 [Candidatus Falkowbacteria bacterium RIFOXYC12_FULL_34_55]OGF37654.1 MAG: hypothetical protein A2466_05445 [Candidatus Falkowbacteria bacterium RIFOXYC2_FULL_34_220]OGF39381.1 MAG: hypothetical protein A2515_02675 [Candidatus Falkowbacteria bacterium RIFOXYD12_FULL_34_57]OGF41910.1 MAG: hypothetical protein A2531_04740 [Candidatus Falkowbacteria bact
MKFIKLQKGFSLVELLVTIAIIGLLTTMAVVGVRVAQTKSKIAKAEHEVDTIFRAMGVMANDTGYWPGLQPFEVVCTDRPGGCPAGNEICSDGCAYGLSDPRAGLEATDGNFPNWSGPYMAQVPLDSWGNEYFFDTDYSVNASNEPCNGGGGCHNVVVVGSYGPDGVGDGQYNSDDIIKIIAF